MPFLLVLIAFWAGSLSLLAQESKVSDIGFKRLGQIIHLFFDRFAEAATYVGKGNFSANVAKPVFSRDFRKMQLRMKEWISFITKPACRTFR
jgi:hypothetical protein